jgi:peptide/nickel transport system permease protein
MRAVLRRLRRVDGIVASAIISLILACLIGAQWIATHDPYDTEMTAAYLPPSAEHLMGTDEYGRDIFSRVVYGARHSLAMGFAVSLISSAIGLVVGGVAGFSGGSVDEVIMRLTDIVMGFPAMLFAMVISVVLGSGHRNAILAACAVWWPSYVRLLRGQVLSVKNDLYVLAATAIGAPTRRIVLRHILPNSWGPIIVRNTMDLGRAVLFTGALSFIGLGAKPPTPEWGAMLAEARWHILHAWWYTTFPGLAIFAAVFAFSLMGDILNESLRGA